MNKMLIVLPAMLLMGQLDLANPFNQLLLRITFFSLQGFMLLLAGYMYFLITGENNQRKIRVPPPATPSFMQSGPPAEPEEMTVRSYDLSELKKFVTQIVMGVAICSFIHFKWEIAQPLFIQAVMAPFTLYDCALFRLHVLKVSEQKDPSLKRPFAVKDNNPFAALLGTQEPEPVADAAPEENKKEKRQRRKAAKEEEEKQSEGSSGKNAEQEGKKAK